MKSVYGILLCLFLTASFAQATHLKGGEIIATNISGQTFSIKARLYLDMQNGEGAANAMTSVTACMGDGNTKELIRTRITPLPLSHVSVAEFEAKYTFPSAGIFQIAISLDNRSGGMLNLPNALGTSQFIWTVIDTQSPNSTPVLPYLAFVAGVRQVFTIDLKPTVLDPDSISARVARVSKPSPGACGVRMLDHTYLFPNEISATGTFKIEPATNQLVWKAPEMIGEYIFAMVITEWRNGLKVSESYREGVISVIDKPGETVQVPPYESSEHGGVITSVPQGKSVEMTMAVEAYPVPTQDFVTVKAYSKKRAIIRLELIDMNGRIVREIASRTPEILVQEEFDMRNLVKGMYLIRASNATDTVTQKVVR